NLLFSNSTGSDHIIAFANPAALAFSVRGNMTTTATGSGLLTVRIGSQGSNALDFTIVGNLLVGPNTILGAGVFNAIHSLTVEGNLTNNGTLQFSNAGQYSAAGNGAIHLTFAGATD